MSFQFAVYISSKLYYLSNNADFLLQSLPHFFYFFTADAISTDAHSHKFNVYCEQFASPFFPISHVECGTESLV